MNIVYAFADSQSEWNTSEWRGHIPSNGLNTHKDHEARMIPIQEFANYGHDTIQAVVGPADVIVVQRNLITPDIWEACDYWRALGKTVVADLDDDYPHLTPQNPAYKFWILDKAGLEKSIGKTPIEALTEGFRHVDALISPNENIIKDWSDVVPRGYWVPNYAHWPWYEEIKQKPMPADDEPIIIGWGGSVSHFDSWWFSGLRDAVEVISERYPRVVWKICGGDLRVKSFFGNFGDRYIDQPGVPPQEWPKQVASFDIGLAPLCGPGYPQGERYDLRRSWLKSVEYLLAGVPWIASGFDVYGKLDGQGGFIVENTPEAWIAGLSEILDNLDKYKAASLKLMPWARDNLSMPHVVDKYVETFVEIMTQKAVDNAVRIPGVHYAADLYDQTEQIGPIEIEISEDDMPTLAGLQERLYHLSATWHDGLDIQYGGVNLAECLQYPILETVNAITYEAEDG